MSILSKSLNYLAYGQVWRVLYDHQLKVLLVEMRSSEEKEVCFSCLRLENNEVLWEGLQLKEKWWVTMAGLKDGFLYFNEFAHDQRMPKVKKMEKLDILEAVIVQDDENDPELVDTAKGIQNPIIYPSDSEHISSLIQFLTSKGLHPTQDNSIHYLETEEHIIFCFLENVDDKLQRKIVVCTMDGEILYDQVMDKEVKEQIMDSFFVIDQMLVYIEDKITLCGVPLLKNNYPQ
ncbi:DUF4905 domain-containing protein [Flammeovirga pacifica]|uniref:DUF4905 domain-containing protein n=1 Tax=Flammeovirga pacifica TaxID=915059 RepID=A0A1S1Z4J9_FLAPC|nr:DUF4905 domain-containing protein [Flammeovirga pacifica]OHX68214.1 hypothetical protein NH26_18595 [Flammeovirga pacifica]